MTGPAKADAPAYDTLEQAALHEPIVRSYVQGVGGWAWREALLLELANALAATDLLEWGTLAHKAGAHELADRIERVRLGGDVDERRAVVSRPSLQRAADPNAIRDLVEIAYPRSET